MSKSGKTKGKLYKNENGIGINFSIVPDFIKLCKMTQVQLKEFLPRALIAAGYTDIAVGDGFIYAKGTIPVLLTAHMDTVHKSTVSNFYEQIIEGQHIISSPQGIGGDDRCGIYIILKIVEEYKCSVLFCEDEEIGGVGSGKFCDTDLLYELNSLHYLIELDRAHANDAVFYECDNPEFTEFIIKETGFKECYGTFSDISIIAPQCGIAAVNLSCGYYYAHTVKEEVVVEEMLNTIEVVKRLLLVESKQYEYIERSYGVWHDYERSYRGGYKCDVEDWFDDMDTYSYRKGSKKEKVVYLLVYVNDGGCESEYCVNSSSAESAWGKFFLENGNICFNDVYDYEIF